MANTLKYGTYAVGAPNSLARARAELRDAIKGGVQTEITAAVRAIAAIQMPGVKVETMDEFFGSQVAENSISVVIRNLGRNGHCLSMRYAHPDESRMSLLR